MNIIRLKLIFFILVNSILFSQSTDELKRFMETYDKLKIDQQANEVVKRGIESEKDDNERPVRLLVRPGDINKYYNEKLSVLQSEISKLNNLLVLTDSVAPLKDFGYNFFTLRDSIPIIDNFKVDDNYVLGFGDEVIISVWGEVEQYEKKIIQRDGTVYISNVGLLYLGGKTISDAKSYVFDRFSKVYSTLNIGSKLSFFEFSIGLLKNVNIQITGHIHMPGNYVVSPSTNIINMLILSGGIKKTGSLRNIYLSRNNSIIDTIDLYPFISGINNFNNTTLMDNDLIIIPPKNRTVAINGAVQLPAYFEIKNENIKSALLYAGGFSRHANDLIHLYGASGINSYINTSQLNTFSLSNGDSIYVPFKKITPNNITVSVENKKPIKIPWVENLSYMNIFSSANIDINNIKSIELVRRLENNTYNYFILQNYIEGEFTFLPFDHISIQLFQSKNNINTVTIKGAVNSPGLYAMTANNETLNSLVKRSGGFINNVDLTNVTIKRDTSIFGSIDGNLVLSPNDTVFVKNYNSTVNIIGEVNNPGIIEWKESRDFNDYLQLAGGLTAYGDKKYITYITPYGEAFNYKKNKNIVILPGSKIEVSRKPLNETSVISQRFQQVSSIITSLVTLAILANTTSTN